MGKQTVCIIGYTGFVGGHLREAYPEADLINRSNMDRLVGASYDLVFCSCVPAVKWLANKEPDADLAAIREIQERVGKLGPCGRFVLISTIDVHDSAWVCEGEDDETHVSSEPYGQHRWMMEQWVNQRFTGSHIVRLPALFGLGIKKNAIYDLLNGNMIDKIDKETVFQWYDLSWLADDVTYVLEQDIRVANLYTQPLKTKRMIDEVFGVSVPEPEAGKKHLKYRHKTRFLRFARSTDEVIEAMKRFKRMYLAIRDGGLHERLAVSTLCWGTLPDSYAMFVLRRYGIMNVEMVLTKYGTWDEYMDAQEQLLNKVHNLWVGNGFRVVSLQAVLYGIANGGNVSANKREIAEHLRRVVGYADALGAGAIVVGAPKLRVAPGTPKDVRDILEQGSGAEGSAVLCLEPNARGYGCEIGTNMSDVKDIVGESCGINFDTGNALMEADEVTVVSDRVCHMQISMPFLKPFDSNETLFRSMMQWYDGVLKDAGYTGYISLEMNCSSARSFVESIRLALDCYSHYL
jgi:sugar phosphate isomerase/epimerase/nucleoside-diphosphate-sugar epimerase